MGGCGGAGAATKTLGTLDAPVEVLIENLFMLFVAGTVLAAFAVVHSEFRNGRRFGISIAVSILALELLGAIAILFGEPGAPSVVAIGCCIYAIIQLRSPECRFHFIEVSGTEDFPYKLIAIGIASTYFAAGLAAFAPAIGEEMETGFLFGLAIVAIPLVVHALIAFGIFLRWKWTRYLAILTTLGWGALLILVCALLLLESDSETVLFIGIILPVYAAPAAATLWALTRKDVVEYFDQKEALTKRFDEEIFS